MLGFVNQSTLLVTGGAGFIGSHVVDLLLEQGHCVVVFDDFSTGKETNLPTRRERLRVVEGDVGEALFAPLLPVVNEWGKIEHIIHLAAQTSVVRSIERPQHDLRVNLLGTVNVMEYARYSGTHKLVFASSAAVYGDVKEVPVSEEAVTTPLSPYGVDKLASEHYLRYYAAVHGVGTTPLRFFNVYGARQDPKSPYSGVISIFLDRASTGKDLRIFGDGAQTRDFVHVHDVARAITIATFSGPGDGRPFNIGTGQAISILELANRVAATVAKQPIKIQHGDARSGEIRHSVADTRRARDELKFTAEVGFDEGLARTASWFLKGQSV